MDKYYVYIYLDPNRPGYFEYDRLKFNHEPFWVGKGSGNRLKAAQHTSKKNNSALRDRVKEIGTGKVIVMKLADKLSESKAFEMEKKSIATIGRITLQTGPLVNESDGGLGNSGYKHTDERKRKISVAMKGKSAGEKSHRAKLTADQVDVIRTLEGKLSISKIALAYGVSSYCIWAILKKKNWPDNTIISE